MKKKNTKYIFVGFFSVIVLIASYWGFNYLKGTNLFTKTNTYFAIYNRIDGLISSAPVTVNGFRVGQVDRIELLPGYEGLIQVTMSVREDIRIPEGSTARIYSMDLMGSKGIELLFVESTSYHSSGDELIADIEKSLKDEVNYQMLPLKNQAEDLMSEIQAAIEIVRYIFNQETRDNLEKSFESIRYTFQHLETSAHGIDTLISGQSDRLKSIFQNVESISNNLRRNNEQITNILDNVSSITDSIALADITTTINQARLAITEFNIILEKINKGEGSLGLLLNDDKLYKDLDHAASSLDKLLTDFRLNPKKYVNFSLMNIGRTIHVSDESELSRRDLRRLERQREKEEKTRQKNLEKENQEKDSSDDSETGNDQAMVYFMIQIKSGPYKIPANSDKFKNHTDVVEIYHNGIYKYLTALHYDTEHTGFYLEMIREDFSDAFAIAFKDKEMITYTEGKELILRSN